MFAKSGKVCFWAVFLLILSAAISTKAQVVPDQTLPNNSSVSAKRNLFTIKGGTKRDKNLFHSFRQFSLPTGKAAFFNNSLDIENTITRVTGDSVSSIDGILRASGKANLFLINPNGIVLGPNARLEIGGSFLGSTASSVLFQDGFEFSSRNPSESALLTISVPVGLRIKNPGSVSIQGSGHTLQDSPFSPFVRQNASSSFQTLPGRTLALIGGDVTLAGGVLTAVDGKIELGSVADGTVRFTATPSKWTFNYEQASSFRDIQLEFKSLVDTSGLGGGSVELLGRNISLTDGSLVLIQNLGIQPSGLLKVTATESLETRGVAPDVSTRSGLYTETLGDGQGAALNVSAPRLLLNDAAVATTSYGSGAGGDMRLSAQHLSIINGAALGSYNSREGNGGNLTANISESIEINGSSQSTPESLSYFQPFSALISNTAGSGDGGDVFVNAKRLILSKGGAIGTNVVPAPLNQGSGTLGKGGDVTLNISDSVTLSGVGPETVSAITSSTFGRGKAGRLTLNTSRLSILDGATVTVSTYVNGDAGDVLINVSDSVELTRGYIISSAVKPIENIQKLLGLPSELSGSPGGITLNAPSVLVTDGSAISVQNDGIGKAGTLRLNADLLQLTDGTISATTRAVQNRESEQAREVDIESQNIQLRNSTISATAIGSGEGGNIRIKTGVLVGLENSIINADAQRDRGGQISIDAQGVFFSPDSSLSASGGDPQLDGIIEVNAPEIDFAKASATPVIAPESPQVSSACQSGRGSKASSFTNIGAGGIPSGPSDPLTRNVLWEDNSSASQQVSSNSQVLDQPIIPHSADTYVEAQGWKSNGDGTVDFVTDATESLDQTALAADSCK